MKTKNIFKALVAAMLMPAMLLTTACGNEDDAVNNTENTVKKGYEIPVTINVTRQGEEATTRATFDDGTKKLSFSSGDKLFVNGAYADNGMKWFAGTLTWVSDGTFSGTITTQTEWTGSFDALLASAQAALLPAGYEDIGYLSINDNKSTGALYDDYIDTDASKAFATSKADAVAQFSNELSDIYSSGFALSPQNAILNFTITDLTASTEVAVAFTNGSSVTISGNVTPNSGTATFAVGVSHGTDLNNCTLTVGGNAIPLVSSSKTVAAGKIYNITRSVAPTAAVRTLSEATTDDIGKVVCAAGHLHDAKTAVPSECTAVGILGKVTATGHGLILALQDATSQIWNTINGWTSVTAYASSTLKLLPDDARGSLTSYTTLGSTTVSNWCVAQKADYEAIFTNLGSETGDNDGKTYDAYVNAYITTGVGGTAISGCYWSATEKDDYSGWRFLSNCWVDGYKEIYDFSLRPVLAF